MRRPSPWLALSLGAALLAAAGAVGEFRNPPGGDAASLLYGAERILDGAKLYRDLVDLNPPFVFLFHIPFVAAARLVHVSVFSCFRVGILLLILLSFLTLVRVLRSSHAGRGTWHALVAAFLLGSLGLVVGFFGEREHLQFVLMFPYLALASLHAAGDHPPRGVAAWTGVLAGVGLALKVTAGLVPVLILAVLWFGRRVRSDESLWALGVLALCTAAGLLWAPGYYAITRELGGFYRGFSGAPAATLILGQPMAWMCGAALVAAVATGRSLREQGTAVVWGVAVIGFIISLLAQGKGFLYHYLPAEYSALTLVMLLLASEARQRSRLDAARRAVAAAVVTLIAAVPLNVVAHRLTSPVRDVGTLGAPAFSLLGSLPRGTSVAVESSRLGDAFPLALMHDLHLTGRFPHLWFFYPYDSAAARLPQGIRPYADSVLTPLERRLRDEVAADFSQARPAFLLIRSMPGGPGMREYLCDDRLFARASAGYVPVRSEGELTLYRRGDGAGGVCPGR